MAKQNPRCVFVGRTADYVLRDNPNTVNIFITASMDTRIANVCERRGCSKEEARKFIENGEASVPNTITITQQRFGGMLKVMTFALMPVYLA